MASTIPKKTSKGRKRNRLCFPEDAPGLAAGLTEAFARIVAYATDCPLLRDEDPQKAVHEFRKSCRRARALVKLTRPLTGERSYQELNCELRRTVHATSELRDADVLLELVAAQERTAENREQLDALEELLRAEQRAHRAGAVDEALSSGVERLRRLPARYARSLPWDLDGTELASAMQESYRRGRDRYKKVKKRPHDHEAIHDWRKRVKELRYQLELLGARREGPAQQLHAGFERLAEQLGVVTDRIALHDLVAERAGDLREHQPERLRAELAGRVEEATRVALDESKELFRCKPKAFARDALAGVTA